jgi:hypothetical protein
MRFGKTVKEAGGLQEGSGGGNFLRNVKSGDTTIRFLYPTEQWITFKEHFVDGRSFPCSEEKDCFGCNQQDPDAKKKREKVATNVYSKEFDSVESYKFPKTIFFKAQAREERRGEITDRDYTIMREGEGLKTSYDLDTEDKYPVDIESKRKEGPDIGVLLETAYEEAVGSVTDSPEDEAPLWSKEEKKVDVDVTDAPWDKKEEVYTEQSLRAMTKAQLEDVAEDNDVSYSARSSKKDILAAIMADAG